MINFERSRNSRWDRICAGLMMGLAILLVAYVLSSGPMQLESPRNISDRWDEPFAHFYAPLIWLETNTFISFKWYWNFWPPRAHAGVI